MSSCWLCVLYENGRGVGSNYYAISFLQASKSEESSSVLPTQDPVQDVFVFFFDFKRTRLIIGGSSHSEAF